MTISQLPKRYLYGVLAAAVGSCLVVGVGDVLSNVVEESIKANSIPIIAVVALVIALPGSFLGLVGAVMFLSVPLAVAARQGPFLRVIAGAMGGIISDIFSIGWFYPHHYQSPLSDFHLLTGTWITALAVDNFRNGEPIMGAIGLAMPIFAGAIGGLIFHRVLQNPVSVPIT
jgi:hypothetical protein